MFTWSWSILINVTGDTLFSMEKRQYPQEMKIPERIEFGNIHRFAKKNAERPRPIIARFLYYSDTGDTLFSMEKRQYPHNCHQKYIIYMIFVPSLL
jgi:hypothetical protein